MNPLEGLEIGLAVGLFCMLVAVGQAVWFSRMNARAEERREKHLTDVMDRFLSRHFEEYKMADMIARTAQVEQEPTDADPTGDAQEDEALKQWQKEHPEAAQAIEALANS